MNERLDLKFYDNNLENKNRVLSKLSFWNSGKFRIIYPDWNQARYRIYTADWKGIADGAINKTPFITFSKRLQRIIALDNWMEAVYQSFNAPEDPLLSYKAIDDETWNFYVFYDDDIYPRAEWVKPIETIISKKELVETLYIWYTKRIIECYNWAKRYKYGKISETEPLSDFFDKKIDIYLKEQWVDNIDELVKRAREIIRMDMNSVYDGIEKKYFW